MNSGHAGRLIKQYRWFIGGAAGALALMLVIGFLLYRHNLQPVSGSSSPQSFTVATGEGSASVAAHLKRSGLIRDAGAFMTYLSFHGLRSQLKAGTFQLDPASGTATIAAQLTSGKSLSNRLVVPEGSQLDQIQALAAKRGISEADFQAALAAPHDQAFLSGKPANVSLEGYLFPDSYETTANTTAQQLVATMLNTFGEKVGPEYAQAYAAEGLTLHQGLTIASIVEREINNRDDRPVVAQIFLKRYREKQTLGSDVTTEYAAHLLGVPFNVDLNSPYNTRKTVGLPPGPICSPGLSAMDAVAHPATTDYSYFLTGKDGKTYFAHTYAEHQANISKYLN